MKKSEERHSSGPGPSNPHGHHEHHDHEHHDHKHHHEHTHEHGHEHHHGHHDHEHHHSEPHAHAHVPTTKEQLIIDLNINENGYTLWKWAHHSSHENEMISPCGLCIAMAVLQLGSTGHTFKEISSTFKSPGEHGLITGLHELLNSYQASHEDGTEHTHVTTIVFIPSDSTLRRDFVHVVETKFAAVIQTVDYSAEDVLDQMNSHIDQATKTSTEDPVIKAEDLKDHPCVMVISVECFQDQWKLKFDPGQTTSEAFFNGGGKKVDVSMMKINGKFPYADFPAFSAAILGLPFVGDRYMMVIVLPHKRYGLADMERRIDSKFFDTAHLLLKSDDLINVQLPKFTFKTTLDIKFICDKMGMKAMFHDTADLNGMFEKHHHERVTKLTQVLSINVNEFGTGVPPTTALSSPAAAPVVAATANETNIGQTGDDDDDDDSGSFYHLPIKLHKLCEAVKGYLFPSEPSPPPPQQQQHIIEQQQQQPVEESTGTTTAATSTQQSIPFRVDHPFMYYIVDLKYHYVLLMGIQTKCLKQFQNLL